MNLGVLQQSSILEDDFKQLVGTKLTYIDEWNDPLITHHVQRMYQRRKTILNISNEYIAGCQAYFDKNGTH